MKKISASGELKTLPKERIWQETRKALEEKKIQPINKAEINNSIFSEGCFRSDNTFLSQLSILFVVYPEDVVDKDDEVPKFIEKKIKSA